MTVLATLWCPGGLFTLTREQNFGVLLIHVTYTCYTGCPLNTGLTLAQTLSCTSYVSFMGAFWIVAGIIELKDICHDN